MPINSELHYDGALILAAELRDQFAAALAEINALKARVAALEQGVRGNPMCQQHLSNAAAGQARNFA